MKLQKAKINDLEHFCHIRKEGIRPNLEREGLKWNEQHEDYYHRQMFKRGIKYGTLYRIIEDKEIVGYMGIAEVINIGIWIGKHYRNKGYGTQAIRKVFDKYPNKRFAIDVFKHSPARELYERLGYEFVSENEHYAYLERDKRL